MTREDMVHDIALDIWENWKACHECNFGPLREADIRSRIRYIVRNWEQIKGLPMLTAADHWQEIAEEAIAQSFAVEIATAIGWEVRLTVLVAARLLEESNCHTEARVLLETAQRMGVTV